MKINHPGRLSATPKGRNLMAKSLYHATSKGSANELKCYALFYCALFKALYKNKKAATWFSGKVEKFQQTFRPGTRPMQTTACSLRRPAPYHRHLAPSNAGQTFNGSIFKVAEPFFDMCFTRSQRKALKFHF